MLIDLVFLILLRLFFLLGNSVLSNSKIINITIVSLISLILLNLLIWLMLDISSSIQLLLLRRRLDCRRSLGLFDRLNIGTKGKIYYKFWCPGIWIFLFFFFHRPSWKYIFLILKQLITVFPSSSIPKCAWYSVTLIISK